MHLQRVAIITLVLVMGVSCATQLPFQWGRSPQASSGTSVKLIEDKREIKGGITEVVYRLEPIGFSVGKPLELWTKHGNKMQEMGSVEVDEQGKVRWKNKKKPGDFSLTGLIVKGLSSAMDKSKEEEVKLVHRGYFIAESREWALFDRTSNQVAFAKAVPFPVVAEGPGGCRLSLELLSPDGMNFEIIAEGFKPGEELNTTSKSDGELIQRKGMFPQSGPLMTLVLPGVIGKTSGEASYTVEGTQCTVTLQYKWGQAAQVVQ